MKTSARLIALTEPVEGVSVANAEALVAYCARVSNPSNQDNPEYDKFINYCIKNKHWSIFQMVNAVVEIKAPRDITRQFTRHGSLFTIEVDGSFKEEYGFDQSQGGIQEFSQRYSDEIEFTDREYRRKDSKNRQNSTDDLPESLKEVIKESVDEITKDIQEYYKTLIDVDVAKECARVILPEGLTMSTLYVNGTLRSWLHFLDVRDDEGVTQYEHVLLAREIRKVIEPAFPKVFATMKKLKQENV